MAWYWKVRLHRPDGDYWHCEIKTAQNLAEIATIQLFYESLTECDLLIVGMSESPSTTLPSPNEAFHALFLSPGSLPTC